jgi:hypothetical protein
MIKEQKIQQVSFLYGYVKTMEERIKLVFEITG